MIRLAGFRVGRLRQACLCLYEKYSRERRDIDLLTVKLFRNHTSHVHELLFSLKLSFASTDGYFSQQA